MHFSFIAAYLQDALTKLSVETQSKKIYSVNIKKLFIPLRSYSLMFVCAAQNFTNVSFHSSCLCFSGCVSAT